MKGNNERTRRKNKVAGVASYDKIFREVSPTFLSVLIERVLKLDIVEFEELKDKLQMTQQLETDTLRKVTDSKGNISILHVEIESKSDRMMPARMAHYFTMLHLLYKLPITQYVIYIGERVCTIPERLKLKRFRQLRMMTQLRNFDLNKIQKDMSTVISKIFKAERDPFFKMGEKRGEKRGIEQGTTQLIQKLIANTGSTDAEISRITDVPVETIRKIRAGMKKGE